MKEAINGILEIAIGFFAAIAFMGLVNLIISISKMSGY